MLVKRDYGYRNIRDSITIVSLSPHTAKEVGRFFEENTMVIETASVSNQKCVISYLVMLEISGSLEQNWRLCQPHPRLASAPAQALLLAHPSPKEQKTHQQENKQYESYFVFPNG